MPGDRAARSWQRPAFSHRTAQVRQRPTPRQHDGQPALPVVCIRRSGVVRRSRSLLPRLQRSIDHADSSSNRLSSLIWSSTHTAPCPAMTASWRSSSRISKRTPGLWMALPSR